MLIAIVANLLVTDGDNAAAVVNYKMDNVQIQSLARYYHFMQCNSVFMHQSLSAFLIYTCGLDHHLFAFPPQ